MWLPNSSDHVKQHKREYMSVLAISLNFLIIGSNSMQSQWGNIGSIQGEMYSNCHIGQWS